VAFKPALDLEACINNRRPFLPGNWQLIRGSWDQFEKGGAEAVRTIRHRGRTYWLSAEMTRVDGFAGLVAFGMFAGMMPKYYTSYCLHRVDPRSDEYTYRDGTMLGSLTTIKKVVNEEGWHDQPAAAS
jgi:hypothetical protein